MYYLADGTEILGVIPDLLLSLPHPANNCVLPILPPRLT